MILAQNLSKQYPDGTKGLDALNVKIEQGEFVAIIGRSGAGKSTFLRQVNGTILPTDGKLEVLGCKVREASLYEIKKLRRHIGFIFQQFNLVKSLTVMENVLIGRLGYHGDVGGSMGLFTDEDKNLARHYLQEVGLDGRFNSRADQLSGGQQQRVAIARALVQDPKIILADEPMASLDPKLSEVVLDLLKLFNEKKKITVIVNIHVLELAKKYATRIIGLKAGRLIYDGPIDGLTDEKLRLIYD
ncbi:MAG: phosphonate ABC transporter ATP-binding protein [Oligoflexia bacterium]|nr:phosphonate ABC transporter ATP-binding protein [Oligoflexia bacterium]